MEKRIKKSNSPWKIVYFQHPAHSSRIKIPSSDGIEEIRPKNSERKIHFPFSEWGVSLVLNGHIHVYERFDMNSIPYVTDGVGGEELYEFCDQSPESLLRFSGEQGATLVEENKDRPIFEFYTVFGKKIGELILLKNN